VLDRVDPEMAVVRQETFGPVSPVISFRTIDDAIRISNSTAYGLSSAVCTNRWTTSRAHLGTERRQRERARGPRLPPRAHAVRCIKDSGLGYKEGVQEAIRSFTNVKTYSLPWLP